MAPRLYTSLAGPSRSSRPAACSGLMNCRRADRRARQRLGRPAGRRRDQRRLRVLGRAGSRLTDRLGQAPVHHQGLAVLAQHDVARLQVAVQHPAAVGVRDRVADVEEAAQQLPQREHALARIAIAGSSARWNRSIASLRLSPWISRIA